MADLSDSGFDLTTNYSDYGDLPSSTADNTVTTDTPDASGDIYSDTGGTPDTTSYNWDGTTNSEGTAYAGDLTGIGIGASEIAKLLGNSPLLKTLGAVGISKLADKLFNVQQGPGGYKGGIPTLVASRQQYALPAVPLSPANQARVTDEGIRNAFGQQGFTDDRAARTMYRYGISPERVAGIMGLPVEQVQQRYHAALGPNQSKLGGMYGSYDQTTHPARTSIARSNDLDYSYRRPGSGGITYFSPMKYLTPAQAAAQAQTPAPVAPAPAEIVAQPNPTIEDRYATGGITGLGGYSDGGRLLRGPGDGVSDSIPATIGKGQPARLADGEFVIPARIVSELGNGSTEAGARKLYAMMDRIKKARSKAKNIAADTKADKHLPA